MEQPNQYIVQTLIIDVVLSIIAGYTSYYLIKQYIPIFISRKLYGIDQCKAEAKPVAEPMGVIAAAVYLIFMFIIIPVPFYQWIKSETEFPYIRLLALLGAIISICTAILLGFADDVLDLRWRHKLLFPTLSSLPLLMVYYVSGNSTAVLLPKIVQNYIGTTYLDIGLLFYVYMMMLVIFCTNAVNIIAGINGVEAGQGLVIASSVALFNLIQIHRLDDVHACWNHTLSFCILMPFIASTIGIYLLNKYPAKVFVGDTYCYWAGMTLAVVGILGHFSKTLILFCIPQVINFLYSVPQLFHLVPCPRHRLPKFMKEGDQKLHMSMAEFELDKIHPKINLGLLILNKFGLLHYEEFKKEDKTWIQINNMTILNLILKFTGPLYEYQLNYVFLGLQIFSSFFAFLCRFYLSHLLYDVVH